MTMELETSEGVYKPAEDSFLLAENLDVRRGDRVLEVGTGTGVIALTAAEKAEYVLGVDVNPDAVELAGKNAESNGIANVEFMVSDLFENVDGVFDLIVFNPPYLPVEGEDGAWSGGGTGREVIDRFLAGAAEHLKPGGRMRLLISSFNDVGLVVEKMGRLGFTVEVAAEEKLFFETLCVLSGVYKTGR